MFVLSNMIYKYKDLKFGIIVLCPNLNLGHLRNTVSSIDIYYPQTKAIIVLPSNCSKDDMDTTSKLKKTYKADSSTMSSLLNCGLNHAVGEWNLVILSKGWMKSKIDVKYSYFIENEKDILFPITDFKNLNFVDTNINLILIHEKAFKDIGEFPDMENFELSKLVWATKAISKKYKFKGIVGGKCF